MDDYEFLGQSLVVMQTGSDGSDEEERDEEGELDEFCLQIINELESSEQLEIREERHHLLHMYAMSIAGSQEKFKTLCATSFALATALSRKTSAENLFFDFHIKQFMVDQEGKVISIDFRNDLVK